MNRHVEMKQRKWSFFSFLLKCGFVGAARDQLRALNIGGNLSRKQNAKKQKNPREIWVTRIDLLSLSQIQVCIMSI